MFDYLWANTPSKDVSIQPLKSEKYIPTVWSEHCIECSAPDCYQTCKIYKARKDHNCVRITNGISPLAMNASHSPVGAQLHFRKWAKIESPFYSYMISDRSYQKLIKKMNRWALCAKKLSAILPLKLSKLLTDGVYSLRRKYVYKKVHQGEGVNAIHLMLRAKCSHEATFIVEIKTSTASLFRESIRLTNQFRTITVAIPECMPKDNSYISIYPEDVQKEHTVTVEFLELVKGADSPKASSKKVKCVIWDLDNTLWNGVLLNSPNVTLNPRMLSIIQSLDEKGIVSCICSKNNEEDALKKLREFGIADLFVFNRINWEPKSSNIKDIITSMNIAADTIVFVDDTPFERDEVKTAIPDITVLDVSEIEDYVQNERFNVPITEDAKQRRNTYKMLEKQQTEFKKFDGNIDEFLISCEMKMKITKPLESQLERCYELLQRTNQLNASGRRLSYDEIEEIYHSSEYSTYVLDCEDRFGKYGIVGFLIVENKEIPVITDFVISCRVANKKIEHATLNYLCSISPSKQIKMCFQETNRNGPMHKVITDLQMKQCVESNQYLWDGDTDIAIDKIVTILKK